MNQVDSIRFVLFYLKNKGENIFCSLLNIINIHLIFYIGLFIL